MSTYSSGTHISVTVVNQTDIFYDISDWE